MTRRKILEKYEIILVKAPEWLDTELMDDEAEVFEKGCLVLKQIFEKEFLENEKFQSYT